MKINIYRNGSIIGFTTKYMNCKDAKEAISKKTFLVVGKVGNSSSNRVVNLIGNKITVRRGD